MSLRRFEIPPVDRAAEEAASDRQNALTKPAGSLGELDAIAVRLAGIQQTPTPRVVRKYIVVAAADHGVAREGVSAYPSEVTAQMAANFLNGGAAVNVLARFAGAEVVIVDAGIAGEVPGDTSALRRMAPARGTENMAEGPAMSREHAEQVISDGASLAAELADSEAHVIATGDMGIGNTTASAAITSVFTGRQPADVTGRGTGVDDRVLAAKVATIERALSRNRPDPEDPVGVLAAVGGFEIGLLAGVMLGAAEARVGVAIDGFISTAAALVASGIDARVRDYAFATHLSAEAGHRAALERLDLKPMLDLGMRLGEGTGAALGLQLMEAAVRLHNEMATFQQASVAGPADEAGQGGESA